MGAAGTLVPVVTELQRDAVERTERWFVARGVPHFIDGYSATRDIFTRAVPVLTIVFVFEMIGALNLSWPVWANVLAVAGGFGLLLGIWAAANMARRRRPLARPAEVGPIELAVFVFGPAVLPLVFGGQLVAAAVTSLGNTVFLGLVYVITGYGLVPMTAWAGRRLRHEVAALWNLLVRALPLLLLFVTFLFINAEVWQVASRLRGWPFVLTLGLFVVVGVVFVVTRLPREIGQLASFADAAEIARLAAGTPAADLGTDGAHPPHSPPLSRAQWLNAGLVALFAAGMQILLVSATIAAFFVLFGMLAVTPATIESWTESGPAVVATVDLGGHAYSLTDELARVAAFLGTFSGLYFTVYVLTDPAYRDEFFDEAVGELRQALAVRVTYLATIGRADTAR